MPHPRWFALASLAGAAGLVALAGSSSTAAPGGVYVDVGGPGYVDGDGVRWAADTGAVGGRATSTRARIGGTDNDRLYQTGRQGMTSYSVPLPTAGRYAVTLHFAETRLRGPGRRVFGISAEGGRLASDLDVYAASGRNRAHQLTRTVDVADRRLDLGFQPSVGSPILQGIAAVPVTTAPESPTATPTKTSPAKAPTATSTAATAGDPPAGTRPPRTWWSTASRTRS